METPRCSISKGIQCGLVTWRALFCQALASGSTLNGKLGRVCGIPTDATTAGGRFQVEVDGRAHYSNPTLVPGLLAK